jgi:hypothetical protein
MSDRDGSILNIILWGASQVGKSTLLASYLCRHKPEWLDLNAPETQETLDQLSSVWNALRENRLPPATVSARLYEVRHKDGHLIHFRDMKGGNAADLARNKEDAAALRQASALMILAEWPGQRTVSDVIAAETALRYAGNRPLVVVITKVECFLTQEKLALFSLNPVSVAEQLDLPPDFVDLLKSVPASDIIPVSVYGYSGGYPAHYRDEFGRLVPRFIKPHNIVLPFERALESLI